MTQYVSEWVSEWVGGCREADVGRGKREEGRGERVVAETLMEKEREKEKGGWGGLGRRRRWPDSSVG